MGDLQKELIKLQTKNKILQDALKQNYHIQQDLEESNKKLVELQKLLQEKNRELEAEKEHRNMVLETTASAIIAFDESLAILTYNKSAERLFGYPEDAVIGKMTLDTVFSFDYHEKNRQMISLLLRNEHHDFFEEGNEVEFKKKDGSLFIAKVAFGCSKAEPRMFVASLEDITREIEQKYMMLQQSRLAAMGEMIGNIAHQWRQPLNTLGLQIQDIQDAYEFGELTEEYLEQSVRASVQVINSMSETIDDFRNFFKPNKTKSLFSLHEVIDDTLALVEAGLKHSGIVVELQLDDSCRIFGFKSEFSQVIVNIIKNAKDVMDERDIKNGKIVIHSYHEHDNMVITIADNAGGIPKEVIGKIFDPYFTTKEEGKGTGIGLYMSKMIIDQNMKGSLTVKNEGEGALFMIVLNKENVTPEIG